MQQALQEQRNKKISEGAVQIAKFLYLGNKAVTIPRASHARKMYTEYVNEIVMEGFSAAILASVAYLTEQVDPERMSVNEAVPLVEVSLELVAPEIQWSPEVGPSAAGDGVRDHFNGWVSGFQNIGTLMKRLDIGRVTTRQLEEDFNVLDAVSEIQSVVLRNEAECVEFGITQSTSTYMNDLQQSLHDFIEEHGTDGEDPRWIFSTRRLPSTRECRRRSSRCRRTSSGGSRSTPSPSSRRSPPGSPRDLLHAVPEQQGDQLDGGAVLVSGAGERVLGRTPTAEAAPAEGGEDVGVPRRAQGELPRRAPKGWVPRARCRGHEARQEVGGAEEETREVMGFMRDVATTGQDGCHVRSPRRHRGSPQDV